MTCLLSWPLCRGLLSDRPEGYSVPGAVWPLGCEGLRGFAVHPASQAHGERCPSLSAAGSSVGFAVHLPLPRETRSQSCEVRGALDSQGPGRHRVQFSVPGTFPGVKRWPEPRVIWLILGGDTEETDR